MGMFISFYKKEGEDIELTVQAGGYWLFYDWIIENKINKRRKTTIILDTSNRNHYIDWEFKQKLEEESLAKFMNMVSFYGEKKGETKKVYPVKKKEIENLITIIEKDEEGKECFMENFLKIKDADADFFISYSV
ncbi:MAG: hypothetical protein M0P91_04700 [Sulfuricurvum sp.]|jgi:hypothetical protein|uniref:hypothetical protein n=1 Tax=Sulfuricurvum sp. TaxID=2025608 RepID=UPI0025D9A5F2|nr:hypothetical protein [Sulfuricurvum sp.]MCK9372475.1 hypothetical protein [Sulfuricurvum sp.]